MLARSLAGTNWSVNVVAVSANWSKLVVKTQGIRRVVRSAASTRWAKDGVPIVTAFSM
ncbi:hypothetical protein D3C84_1025100 [compost metagenome]